jgi:hypothetical protein
MIPNRLYSFNFFLSYLLLTGALCSLRVAVASTGGVQVDDVE